MLRNKILGIVLGAAIALLPSPCFASFLPGPAATPERQNRYEVAGITDPAAFEAFFTKMQEWVTKGDKAKVAQHVQYPLRVNKEGKSKSIKNEKQFVSEYDQIMTDKVKNAYLQQHVTDTFVNYQGVMVGNGEMWLGQNGNKFVIVAINQ